MPDWLKLIKEIYSFHKDQQEKFGISSPGNPHGRKRFWSIRDTAKIYKKSPNWIHQSLIIAKFLEINTDFKPISRNHTWKIAKEMR